MKLNEKEMEFLDEIATQMTEMTYGEQTWSNYRQYGGEITMKKEPKEFYDRRYDEIETLYINLIKKL
jgi:hypothetical protein